MATILHLTDLHLAPPSRDVPLGDYSKDRLLESEFQQRRVAALESSFHSLGGFLESEGTKLDSIVISGDLTIAGDSEGLGLLEGVLQKLGAAMVEADRVLITPGNHDVKWSTAPGSEERYKNLVDLRRKLGYRTALLDGVDIDGNGAIIGTDNLPLLEARDGSYVLTGVNSSNHCGTDARTEDYLQEHIKYLEGLALTDPAVESLLKGWRRRGLFDLVRIDRSQLDAVSSMLPTVRRDDPSEPMRIIALHHPVGPVSAIEEIKSFETMANLGEFRNWIRDHDIDVVLHGHTHLTSNRHDLQQPSDLNSGSSLEHRFLVLGGGTIWSGNATASVATLIDTAPEAPRFRPLRLRSLPAMTHQRVLSHADFIPESLEVRGYEAHSAGIFAGKNLDVVFEQLLGLGDFSKCARPLVCRVDDGGSALKLPRSYPDLADVHGEVNAWLKDTVEWWQRSPKGAGATFNHGERLKQQDGRDFDQIDQVARSLVADTGSSRGVAILVQPRTDFADSAAFPSFVMLHATVSEREGSKYVDLVAYYRKQEIPHWWPVNMAELAQIQNRIVRILATGGRSPVVAGSLTSITSMPVSGSGVPFVSVPWLDRYSNDSTELLSLVTALLVRDRGAAVAGWERAMSDWAVDDTQPADGEPIPLEGIQSLMSLLVGLKVAFKEDREPDVAALISALGNLELANESYRAAATESDRAHKRSSWINNVRSQRSQISLLVSRLTDTSA